MSTPRPHRPTLRPAPLAPRAAAALGAVAGMLVLGVAAASLSTPWSIEYSGPGAPVDVPTTTEPPPVQLRSGGSHLLTVVFVAFLVVVVLVVAWRLWGLPWRRYTTARDPLVEVTAAPPTLGTTAAVVRRALARAEDVLREGTDPTEAVTRAWLALEDAAAHTGHRRRPADSPTEFTVDVLAGRPDDAEAVGTLLRLYHRARFSSRGVAESDLGVARTALRSLAASWSAFDTAAVAQAETAAGRASTDADRTTA